MKRDRECWTQVHESNPALKTLVCDTQMKYVWVSARTHAYVRETHTGSRFTILINYNKRNYTVLYYINNIVIGL